MKNYTIEEKVKIGLQIADILGMKKDKQTDRFETSYGSKTALGVFNTVLHIAEKINQGEEL